jgi:inner membrane protein
MCSILTHPVVPIALSVWFPEGVVSRELLFAGAACSVVADLDVIGFGFGIRYGDMLGHRGLMHSLLFAAVLSALLAFTLFHDSQVSHWEILTFLFLSALSHPLLDMLTNGGLGVALFAPFSKERVFFPWRPVEVSPIGLDFFSEWGARVLLSEFRWVWLPAGAFFVFGLVIRRYGGSGVGT